MQRRTLLSSVAVLAVPLAGCTNGDDDDDEPDDTAGSNNGTSNGSEGGNGNESDEDGSTDDGDGESNGLEILDHEFYEEDFSAGVQGTVANNSGEDLDYVEVDGYFYDEEGTQIANGLDNTQSLDDGQEWAFDVMLAGADAEEVEDYELEVSDSVV